MSLAARLSDMHICPMQTPAVVPIPHVGGPIVQPSAPTVLIGGMPAACAGAMCTCIGPPDVILPATTGARARVLVNKLPLAAMGDMTAHGGTIIIGCPTVLIGTGGVSIPSLPDIEIPDVAALADEIASTTQALQDEQAELEELLEDGMGGDAAIDAQNRLDELDDVLPDIPDF
ncbi:MAG: putative Zn-binding protein involved in type VI secretion [Saprospiraceae bacterium]|jgi:uncharacterized Zn-binding protein involved in type VI secretion